MHTRRDFTEGDSSWGALEVQWMTELAAGGPNAEAALSSLFTAYGALFVKRLVRFGLDADEAQDVAQDLWMEIARAARRWPTHLPVRVYLQGFLRIARLRHFQERGRLPPVESLSDETNTGEVEAMMARLAPSTTTQAEWFDFVRCVRRALLAFEKQHPRLASLLLLMHVEELSLDEAAELLGGDATLAKGQVFSARKKIRPSLQPCLELWPNRQRGDHEQH